MGLLEAFHPDKNFLYNAGVETTREYLDRGKIKKKAPKISLLISPFGMPFMPLEISSTDAGGLIQSLTFTKSRSVPAGNIQIQMAADPIAMRWVGDKVHGYLKRLLWDKLIQPDLLDLFKPMTMVQVWADGYCMCTGIVRHASRSVTADGNKAYTISIDELGALYNQNIVAYKTILWGEDRFVVDDPTKVLMQGAALTVGLPLSQALNSLSLAFLMSSMHYGTGTFPPHFKMSDGLPFIYRMITAPPPYGTISNTSLISQIVAGTSLFQTGRSGSFWELLKSLCPEPFMELFCETGGRTIVTGRMLSGSVNITPMLPGMNYLVARTTPYEIPWTGITPWLTLYPFLLGIVDLLLGGDYVIVTDDDIISKNLGTGDAQQFTIFSANMGGRQGSTPSTTQNRPSVAKGPLNPCFPGGIKTFGQREFEAQIAANSISWKGIVGQSIERMARRRGAKEDGTATLHIPALSSLLNVWFRNASKFREGTMQVRGMPYARPGMYLLYLPSLSGTEVENPRDIGVYYIDNVQYEYSIGESDLTTFSLIRGTPAPVTPGMFAALLFDWEVLAPGLGLVDGL